MERVGYEVTFGAVLVGLRRFTREGPRRQQYADAVSSHMNETGGRDPARSGAHPAKRRTLLLDLLRLVGCLRGPSRHVPGTRPR